MKAILLRHFSHSNRFHATIYPISDTPKGRHQLLDNIRGRLEDLKKVRQEADDHRDRVLRAASRKINSWFVQVCLNLYGIISYRILRCLAYDYITKPLLQFLTV